LILLLQAFAICLCSDYFTVPTVLQATLQAKPSLLLFLSLDFVQKRDEVE
jgi:hypothetical protein